MFPIQPCLNPYNIIQQHYLTVPLKAITFQKDIIQDHSRHCCLLLENNFSTNYQDPRTIYQDPQDEDSPRLLFTVGCNTSNHLDGFLR
jgi:hypothetical protein